MLDAPSASLRSAPPPCFATGEENLPPHPADTARARQLPNSFLSKELEPSHDPAFRPFVRDQRTGARRECDRRRDPLERPSPSVGHPVAERRPRRLGAVAARARQLRRRPAGRLDKNRDADGPRSRHQYRGPETQRHHHARTCQRLGRGKARRSRACAGRRWRRRRHRTTGHRQRCGPRMAFERRRQDRMRGSCSTRG